MAAKKILVRGETENKTVPRPTSEVVRVEESVEDYLKMMLPSKGSAKLDIRPLFSDKSGASFFRCNYWKYVTNDIMVTRIMVDSRYVKVETRGDGTKTITDLTRQK